MTAKLIFILATLTTGLMAGLFFAYTCSVNPGLGKLTDLAYIRVMQAINRAILNPWFFSCFFGAVPALAGAAWYAHASADKAVLFLAGTALLIYIIGVQGVTIIGSIPLNEALDTLDPDALPPESSALERRNFEIPWNRWNLVRTIASILSFLLAVLALYSYARKH